MHKILPRELISLIHHIELNKAGWWDTAVQQLIITSIWLSQRSLNLNEIKNAINNNFAINLEIYKIEPQLQYLCSSNFLLLTANEKYKISENYQSELDAKFRETKELELKIKDKYLRLFSSYKPKIREGDPWRGFNEKFLLPFVYEMGARTYELISGENLEIDKSGSFNNYINGYSVEDQNYIRAAIISFLDPKDSDIRAYIIKNLNAYFLVESSNLNETTLEAIKKYSSKKPEFNIFLDTNFLFSALGIQENPSNEAVKSLLELVKYLKDKININLYVLPLTIEETKFSLKNKRDIISNLRLTGNLAKGASKVDLKGIIQKFLLECSTSGKPIDPEMYFNKYINNLIELLRLQGIKLYDRTTEYYKTNQKVVDDLMDQLDYEQEKRGTRAKGYEQLEHDIILWHFTKDERPTIVESPLEAKYWIATLDFRFLGFDAFKIDKKREKIPICLHPTTIIQMLQFWVPRTSQFETAMLSSMRLPLLFRDFDPSAEHATIEILKILGYYENAGDLPEETITNILLNSALRQKILPEQNIENQIELVKEALIKENKDIMEKYKLNLDKSQKASKELSESREKHLLTFRKSKILEKELSEEAKKYAELKAQLNDQVEENKILDKKLYGSNEKIGRLEATVTELCASSNEKDSILAAKISKEKELECRLHDVEEILETQREKELMQQAKLHFIFFWFSTPFVAIIVIQAIIYQYDKILDINSRIIMLISLFLMIIIWILLMDNIGSRKAIIGNWWPILFIHKIKDYLFYIVISGIIIGLIANYIWENIKNYLM